MFLELNYSINCGYKYLFIGLPLSPLMDRDKVSKPSSQVGFISFVLIPLVQALVNLFPVLDVIETYLLLLKYAKKLKFQRF